MLKAQAIKKRMLALGLGRVAFEDTGNIGKGYRRHDEIGTPLCVTVDFESLGQSDDASLHDTVTVRERDSMQQHRVKIAALDQWVRDYFLPPA